MEWYSNMPKTTTHVIAFDPGVTTGIAWGYIVDGQMAVDARQVRMDVDDLWNFLTQMKPSIVVYERFEFRNNARKGLELFSRELIGVIRLYCITHDIPMYPQQPSEGVGGYYTNKELKANNVYQTSKPHAMDALRHLLQWYTFGPGYQFNSRGFAPA